MALKFSSSKKATEIPKKLKKKTKKPLKHKTIYAVREVATALQKVADFCLLKSDGIQQS